MVLWLEIYAVILLRSSPNNLKLHELSIVDFEKRANQKINLCDKLLQSSLALQEFRILMVNRIFFTRSPSLVIAPLKMLKQKYNLSIRQIERLTGIIEVLF